MPATLGTTVAATEIQALDAQKGIGVGQNGHLNRRATSADGKALAFP